MRQPDQQASYYVAVYMTAPPHVLRMHEGRIVTSLEFPETLVILCNRTDLGIRGRHVHDVTPLAGLIFLSQNKLRKNKKQKNKQVKRYFSR